MPLDSLEPVSPLSSPFSQSSSGSTNNIPSTSGSEHHSSVDGHSSNIHSNSSHIYISSGSSSENEESETRYIPKHIRTKKVFKHSKQHPPDPDDLPPCRVCGERASGLHYGVNTCEPCKVSFYQQLSLKHICVTPLQTMFQFETCRPVCLVKEIIQNHGPTIVNCTIMKYRVHTWRKENTRTC